MITTLFIRSLRGTAFLLLLTLASVAYGQEYASYYNGKKVYYQPSTSQVLVRFKSSTSQAQRVALPATLGAVSMRSISVLPGVTLLNMAPGKTTAGIQQLVAQLANNADIDVAYPVLLNKGIPFGSITDQFIVKLKPSTSMPQFKSLLGQAGVTIHHRFEFDSTTYYLAVSKIKGNALDMANRFYESGLFAYAEPNFVLFVDKTTNDPFYGQQYSLHNTGQTGGTSGADMKVLEAWGITTGTQAVRVAVLDNGVQLNHPDLVNNLLAGYDATGQGTNGGNANNAESHGTSCAGIIGAVANNGIGVAGIAYSCRIVPVRVYTSSSNVDDITTAGWMANGISWVAQNNAADVLSMSFKIHVGQQSITDAINNAVTSGRNGKGCVVLAATGNEGTSSIDFPAACPNAIAIGASNNNDLRASFSQFGPGLDVVAPGVDVYTTDLTGSAGYSTTDYTLFSGTSAATPNAAGVAALILSVNPNLTSTQVRRALESTADKVGGYTYTAGAGENTSYTWNSEMGYGRINACRAVQQTSLSIAGATQFCSGTSAYSVSNSPANLSYTWSSSNTSIATINASSGLATAVGAGPVVFTASTSSGCGVISVSTNVQVGNAPITGTYFCSGCSGQTYAYAIDPNQNYVKTGQITFYINADGNATYTFSTYPAQLTTTSANGGYFNINSAGPSTQRVSLTVNKTGNCGSSSQTFTFVAQPNSPYIVASPNPASSKMTVAATDPDAPDPTAPNPTAASFDAELYDMYGKKVKVKPSSGGKADLDVSDLPDGLYNLRVGTGKDAYSRHIQVSH